VLVLTRADLERILAPREVIDALAEAFRRHAGGRTSIPRRGVLRVGDDGVLFVMPALSRPAPGAREAGGLGAKLVTYYPRNRERGHPTHLASYVLMDHATGEPLALLEASFMTALRTGATSALAAKHLARPDSRRVACFGTSVQAGWQLRCLAAAFALESAVVLGRDQGRARAFAGAMAEELGVAVETGRDPGAAVSAADIVTCATTSPTPLFAGADLRPGTHVDAVGAFRPAEREVDTETVRRARVVVDSYAAALEEAGDLLIPLGEGAIAREQVVAELAELVAGTRQGRTSSGEVTLFKSVGFALEDLATATLAYNRARERAIGTEVAL
jgi:ornithine cyclodeaminase/alanine dehydrogenase